MPYDSYQINDFVTDSIFRKWVLFPDEQSDTFWYQWIVEHSEKNELIKQARILVKITHIPKIRHHEDDFNMTRNQIKAKLFQKRYLNKKN